MTSQSKPRVLHVGKFYPPVAGGMEKVLQLLCERERTSVASHVLVANTSPTTVHEQIGGVSVTRVANLGSIGSVATCPTFPFWLSRIEADVIVIHEPNPLGLLSYLLARPRGRLVVWVHSEVVRNRWKYRLFYRPLFAPVLRRADRVLVASPPMIGADQLQEFADKVEVLSYGIDLKRFTPSEATFHRAAAIRAQRPGPLILFVGRMVPYKGLDVLIRAMHDVKATALLVGDGPHRPALEALARGTDVGDKVAFLGELDEPALVAAYQACDVFVLPSVTRAEAFGVVQLEAMACGKPVVSTNLPTGVPWVNRHEETGLVVSPGDVDGLSSALNRILADPSLRLRLGAHGRQSVLDAFNAERMASQAVALYRRMLAERPDATQRNERVTEFHGRDAAIESAHGRAMRRAMEGEPR